ncbi:hypothetical protein [Nitrosopumilus sp. S6]
MTGRNGKLNEKTHSTIILFDKNGTIEELKKYLSQKNIKIISFDYESHILLENEHISHQISDEFLETENFNEIEKNSFIAAKWSTYHRFDSLIYENIDIANLFYRDFHFFLVPYIKKIFELSKITKKYPSFHFLVTKELEPITNLFSENVSIFSNQSKIKTELVFNSVNYKVKVGKKSLNLSLSKDKFQKLKNFSEKFLKTLNSSDLNSEQKNLLLVEFDTIRFKDLLLESNHAKTNVILYNRRRPTFWNRESYSILKKTKCVVGSSSSFDKKDDFIKNEIRLRQKEFSSQLHNMDKFDIFLINGVNYWCIIKPILKEFSLKWIETAIKEIERVKELFSLVLLDEIVILYESGSIEQIILHFAKKNNVPVFLLSHGLSIETLHPDYLFRREFDGVVPIKSNKLLLWGKLTHSFCIDSKIDSKKLEIIGAPLYDDIFSTNIQKKNDFILFAVTSPIRNFVNDLTVDSISKFEQSVKEISEKILEKGEKLVIKLHPFMEQQDIEKLVKNIDENIVVLKHSNMINLISQCKLLITTDISTSILEAIILQKPVISVDVKDYGFGKALIFEQNPKMLTSLNNFPNTLEKTLNNQEFRQNLLSDAQKFLKEYISYPGKSSQQFFSYLENF